MKRKGMTYAEHRKLGGELQNMDTFLTHLHTDLSNRYGKHTIVARRANTVARAIGQLRMVLESNSVLGKDCPDKPNDELVGVYWGRRVEGSTL